MALTAQGTAQHRRCIRERCEHWRVCFAEARRRGSKWADFCAFHGDRPGAWLNLTREFWEGGASNCPAGYWEGLPLPDLAAEAEAARLKKAAHQVKNVGPVVEEMIGDLGATEIKARLDAVEARGYIEPEAKQEIENELTADTKAL